MLNELYQVVTALEEKGVSFSLPHPSLEPMKNVALMVVRLASGGKPAQLEMLKGDEAERIFRIKHASSGSSFPGINIPLPLRDLTGAPFAESSQGLETLIRLLSQKSASAGTIGDAARALYSLGKPTQFKQRQQDVALDTTADEKDREGKTWMSIPAPRAKNACLLVAYLEEEPDEVDD